MGDEVNTRTIDAKDMLLLNILARNSRLSYRQLAKEAKLSVVTVINRTKALEQDKIIRKYTTDIDYERAGYDITAIISFRISKGKLLDVERKISTHPNVCAVYDCTGNFDAVAIVKFKTRKSLDTFLKTIQTFDFVERTETRLVLNTIKEKQIFVE